MSYTQCPELSHHAGRIKKKSDDFIKRRLSEKSESKKESILPKHAIKPPELADKSFSLPKIPLKSNTTTPPPIQLAMAEIIEDADKEHEKAEEPEDESMLSREPEPRMGPDLNVENTSKASALFAEKQKISIIPLIKMLVPAIEGHTVIVTMTRQQEELIGEVKIPWQAFLKDFFKDPAIVLQIRINEEADTKRKAYTQAEQFQEMLDENEVFKQLVNRLKLKLK